MHRWGGLFVLSWIDVDPLAESLECLVEFVNVVWGNL